MFDVEAAVRQFMVASGQGEDDSKYATDLRIKLIDEEFTELIEAIGWGDKVQIAKELADLVYVVVGTAITMGIPFNKVMGALQISNMSKFDEDGKATFISDGKVLKGPNYVGAELAIREILG